MLKCLQSKCTLGVLDLLKLNTIGLERDPIDVNAILIPESKHRAVHLAMIIGSYPSFLALTLYGADLLEEDAFGNLPSHFASQDLTGRVNSYLVKWINSCESRKKKARECMARMTLQQ